MFARTHTYCSIIPSLELDYSVINAFYICIYRLFSSEAQGAYKKTYLIGPHSHPVLNAGSSSSLFLSSWSFSHPRRSGRHPKIAKHIVPKYSFFSISNVLSYPKFS